MTERFCFGYCLMSLETSSIPNPTPHPMPRTTEHEENKETKSFPKFSSFNRVPSSSKQTTKTRDETDSSIARKRKRQYAHSRHDSDNEYHRHRHRASKEGRPHDNFIVETKSTSERSTTVHSTPGANDLYEIDTKGDQRNILYDSSYKYDIPHFYRFGSGRIIGPDLHLRITSDSERGVMIEPYRPKEASPRDATVFRRRFVYGLPQAKLESPNITGKHLVRSEADFVPCEEITLDPGTEEYSGINKERDGMNAYDKENVDLMKRVSDNPKDTKAWLALIKIQPLVISLEVRKQERNELILSVCEKAWKSNPENAELALQYMRLGSQVWSPDKCSKEWINVISASPHNAELYLEYLQYCISDRRNFTFDAVCRKIEETMAKIKWIVVHKDAEAESTVVGIILLAGMFFRDCGYTELAVGLAQALIELNFFAPVPTSSSDPSTVYRYMSALRSFWDKELPRVGEIGSEGWINANDSLSSELDRGVEPIRTYKGSDWIDKEIEQSDSYGLPTRTLFCDQSDPYQVVFFDDIEGFLYACQSSKVRHQLLCACLILCGFPLDCLNFFKAYDFWAFDTKGPTPISYDSSIPINFQSRLCDLLLKRANLTEEFCVNSLLSWALAADHDNGLRLTKDLLSRRRSDFALWNKYVTFSWQKSPEVARKIAEQCLVLLKGKLESLIISDAVIQLEFLSQSEIETDYLLSKLRTSMENTGATCTNHDENPYKVLASSVCGEAIISDLTAAIVHSGILWDYLSSSAEGQLQLMILKPFWRSLLDNFEETFQDINPLKSLFVNIAKLFGHHMNISLIRNMGEFRDFLTRCIRLFPNEHIFLQFYVANEERNKFDNEVRMGLDRYVLDSPNVMLSDWKFAIEYERSTSRSPELTRTLFERAAEQKRTKFCPALWKCFIEFELSEAMDPVRSKMVLYKAIKLCPGSKEIMLLPFSLLRNIMGPAELRNMAEILLERQIRIRVPLPEDEFKPDQGDMSALPYDSDSGQES